MDRSIGDDVTIRPQAERGTRAFAPGDEIAGRYVVERVLGEGGMGIVYQCLDRVGGVTVAVKCLPPEVSRSADEMEDIRANYRLVANLHHPNIAGARTLEMDEVTGDYYLVMDLARGESLKRWMKRNPQATMEAKLAILRQVASALDYAHAEKVIHRDVKPENVMVDDDGRVKVLDFGLAAQIRSSQSRTSKAVTSRSGTWGYMSPEQWRAKPQREQADVYSFGVLAYWMFAGVLPFDGDDPAVLGSAVLTEPVEPVANLPAHMNAALAKALAKKPEERFASCGVFVDALEGRLKSDDLGSKNGGGGPRGGAWKAILAVAALGLAVAGGWWYYRQEQVREQMRIAAEIAQQKAVAEEAKRRAEEEARQRVAAEEAKRRAEEEARQRAVAEEAKRRAEEEARQKAAAEEAKRKAFFVKTTLQAAQVYFDTEKWQDCIAEADKVLGWEPGNEAAVKLKKDAESHLVPTMHVVAKIDGNEVSGAKVEAGDQSYTTPFVWKLNEGSRYGPYNVSYESGGRRYYGMIDSVTADWRGPREIPVVLREYTGPKVGDIKTITLPGGATMEMIYVAPGSFMMGSPASEEGHYGDETQHRVTLTKGYWLGKYEVTQAQWESVMRENPSEFNGHDRPVENVSWEDCQLFIRKINSQLNCGARLPTEAEWEYACRAGSTGPYGGNGNLDDMGWYYGNSGGQTHPVGQKRANTWGFYDMHGNVLEWCNDRYGDYGGATTDPTGPASGESCVLRGGSWRGDTRRCRSANRNGDDPGYRYDGFRLACSAGPHE